MRDVLRGAAQGVMRGARRAQEALKSDQQRFRRVATASPRLFEPSIVHTANGLVRTEDSQMTLYGTCHLGGSGEE